MPRGLKSLGWLTLLMVFSFAMYEFISSVTDQESSSSDAQINQAFLKVYNLTPDELYRLCGSPTKDVTGQLVENDGIRDIHYGDSKNQDIVFRFLSSVDDLNHWDSLGGWEQGPTSRILGTQVEDRDVLRRMPCLSSASANVVSVVPTNSGRGISQGILGQTAADGYQRATLLSIGLQNPTQPPIPPIPPIRPVPPIHPLPPINPLPPIHPLPPINPLPPNTPIHPFPSNPPSPTHNFPYSNGSSGSGEPEPPGPPPPSPSHDSLPFIIPCPHDSSPCQVIDSVDFLRELRETVDGYDPGERIVNRINQLAGVKVVIVQLPDFEFDRARVMKEIFRLDIQSINIVTRLLRADLNKLAPFKQDNQAEKYRKLAVVRSDESDRRRMWKESTKQAQSNYHARSSGSPSQDHHGDHVIYKPNSALRQLGQVHASGWGSH